MWISALREAVSNWREFSESNGGRWNELTAVTEVKMTSAGCAMYDDWTRELCRS